MSEKYDEIAGEYVLGTLSFEERREFEVLLHNDKDLQAAVKAWEQRLSPLNEDDLKHVLDDFADRKPRDDVWQQINERLDKNDRPINPQSDLLFGQEDAIFSFVTIEQIKQSRNRWRALAVGSMALAASFIGLQAFGILPSLVPSPAPLQNYVAVLNPEGTEPGFLIRVNLADKRLEVERLAGKAPSGKDYELWQIEPNRGPISLNVVGRERVEKVSFQGEADKKTLTFAISLEPEGGSPTGKATGPVIYSGTLLYER